MMKLILHPIFILSVICSSIASATSFSGLVTRRGDKLMIHLDLSQENPQVSKVDPIEVLPTHFEAELSLNKLQNLDYVSGSGSYSASCHCLRVESVDFVGLRDLLGVWIADDMWIHFHNFSSAQMNMRPSTSHSDPERFIYEYSITPGNSTDWKIFFADDQQVKVADLAIHSGKAYLHFIDVVTGQIRKTVELRRLSSYPL